MLVLSRQRDETIMVGDNIEITVTDIRGDKVRIGIDAPRDVTIHRKEVYDAIRREARAAAQIKPEDVSSDAAPAAPAPPPTPQTDAGAGKTAIDSYVGRKPRRGKGGRGCVKR